MNHDLMPIWSDILETLDIARGFKNGEIPKGDVKRQYAELVRRLTRAEKMMDKIINPKAN